MDAIVLLLIAKATTVVGIILIIVLIPIWLPVFVLGGSVLVTRAIWKSSKRDYQNAERDDDNVQRKVQQSERKLQEARQDAILRAERDFEKTQCEVQDDERELEKVRNEAIADVETDLEKAEQDVRRASQSLQQVEQELALLEADLPEPITSQPNGRRRMLSVLAGVKKSKQNLGRSLHEIKIKIAESKLQYAQRELEEACEELVEVTEDLELIKANKTKSTKNEQGSWMNPNRILRLRHMHSPKRVLIEAIGPKNTRKECARPETN